MIILNLLVVTSDASCFSKQNCDLKIGSKCYVYINESVNWFDAEDCCVEWGGHLASPEDDDVVYECDMLASIRNNEIYTWIGLSSITGNLEWTDGTPYVDELKCSDFQDTVGKCIALNPTELPNFEFTQCNATVINGKQTSYICEKSGEFN